MAAELALRRHALWDKVIGCASAQQMIATSDTVHGVRGTLELAGGEAQMLTAQEIACTTHVSYATAITHVALVERVADWLPACWEALDRGQLTRRLRQTRSARYALAVAHLCLSLASLRCCGYGSHRSWTRLCPKLPRRPGRLAPTGSGRPCLKRVAKQADGCRRDGPHRGSPNATGP